MRILKDSEKDKAQKFIDKAIIEAKNSTCNRSKCGSVIVKNNEIIGKGHNSPPNNLESQRRCAVKKEQYHTKVTDRTCCVHAEQRAIINALSKNQDKIKDSIIYFIRLNEKNEPINAGNPYCTICSKMALDTEIKEFVLWHEQGITAYNTEEYNKSSYNFKE